ncbi:MAG: hypothetical protein P1U56_17745 [Saprospiraceae bacterium]|nr:hypothetical protein [Saprospiraceae bacterium]
MKLSRPTYRSFTWIKLFIFIGSICTIAGFNSDVNAASLERENIELLDTRKGNSTAFFSSYPSSHLPTIQSNFTLIWFDDRVSRYHSTIKWFVKFKMNAANYLKFKSNVLEVQLNWKNLKKGRENNTNIQLG